MRIGLFLVDTTPIDQQIETVVAAERDGFDGVWFSDIFGVDALMMIALAGRQTSRIEMGTSVVPVYPRQPWDMARRALFAQAATGGRLTLGIGLSHAPVVEGMWGLSYEKPARHMREYMSVLGPLVREGRVSFQGEVFRTTAGVQVPGATSFPILIAALAPVMLRVAGEQAEGTITWMTGRKTIETHVAPRINAAAEAAGRPKPRICVALPIAVTNDAAGARERAGQMFQVYGQLPNYKRMLAKEGAAGPQDVVVVGNEAEVEQQLRGFAAAGATDFTGAIFPVEEGSMERTRALLQGLVGKV
ncbi:MAG: TIGR03564 family F420-dependent LLM class oxidoreductase [Dehalococcoidia bacterium]